MSDDLKIAYVWAREYGDYTIKRVVVLGTFDAGRIISDGRKSYSNYDDSCGWSYSLAEAKAQVVLRLHGSARVYERMARDARKTMKEVQAWTEADIS